MKERVTLIKKIKVIFFFPTNFFPTKLRNVYKHKWRMTMLTNKDSNE